MASKDIIAVMLFAMLLFKHNCYGLNNMITLILNLFWQESKSISLFTSFLRNIVFLVFTVANATNYVSSCPKISRNLSIVAVLPFVCFSNPQPPTISQIFGSPLKTTCCFGHIEFTFLYKRHNTDLASNIMFYRTLQAQKTVQRLHTCKFFLPTTLISRTGKQKISLPSRTCSDGDF
jgi:hypothetical protein